MKINKHVALFAAVLFLLPLIANAQKPFVDAKKIANEINMQQKKIKKKDTRNARIFTTAAREGNIKLVTALINKGIDPNIKNRAGWTALIEAAYKGHKKIVEILLKAKADPDIKNNDGYTALILAACNGYREIIDILLEAKADPNIKDNRGNTASMWAESKGYKDIAKILKEAETKK